MGKAVRRFPGLLHAEASVFCTGPPVSMCLCSPRPGPHRWQHVGRSVALGLHQRMRIVCQQCPSSVLRF